MINPLTIAAAIREQLPALLAAHAHAKEATRNQDDITPDAILAAHAELKVKIETITTLLNSLAKDARKA